MALGYKYLMGHGVPKKCENAVQAYQRAAYEVQPTPQDLPICLSMYLITHLHYAKHSPSAYVLLPLPLEPISISLSPAIVVIGEVTSQRAAYYTQTYKNIYPSWW